MNSRFHEFKSAEDVETSPLLHAIIIEPFNDGPFVACGTWLGVLRPSQACYDTCASLPLPYGEIGVFDIKTGLIRGEGLLILVTLPCGSALPCAVWLGCQPA